VDIVLAGQAYGTPFFGMSTGFLDRARADLLTESLFIAAMEVLLSLICLAALGTWLTRHLKTLERAAIAISDGQFDVRLPVAGEDELSVVARALNRMGEELASEMAALRRSEQQQREAAARLQAVFDAVPDYLSLSRVSDGRILKANGGFAQLTGYEAEYALGRTTVDLGIWANQAHRDIWISRLMSAGSLADYQTSMRTRDGRLVVVLLSATMLEIDGEPHIVALCKDITERLQVQARIEKARRDLQAVLDAASEVSIIATDPDGLITMFNRGAEKLLGYSAADVVVNKHRRCSMTGKKCVSGSRNCVPAMAVIWKESACSLRWRWSRAQKRATGHIFVVMA
jgi:PAS domain S-box-containing protein